MDNEILKQKIENAKLQLAPETKEAISKVDWKTRVIEMREKRKYNFDQLEVLGTEVEMLLYGLSNPPEFSKTLENKMNINKEEANSLVKELNESIFKKIREELVKIIDTNKSKQTGETYNPIKMQIDAKENQTLKDAGVEIKQDDITINNDSEKNIEGEKELIEKIENPNLIKPVIPISTQKLTIPFKIENKVTTHNEPLTSKTPQETRSTPTVRNSIPKVDPYREIPE